MLARAAIVCQYDYRLACRRPARLSPCPAYYGFYQRRRPPFLGRGPPAGTSQATRRGGKVTHLAAESKISRGKTAPVYASRHKPSLFGFITPVAVADRWTAGRLCSNDLNFNGKFTLVLRKKLIIRKGPGQQPRFPSEAAGTRARGAAGKGARRRIGGLFPISTRTRAGRRAAARAGVERTHRVGIQILKQQRAAEPAHRRTGH